MAFLHCRAAWDCVRSTHKDMLPTMRIPYWFCWHFSERYDLLTLYRLVGPRSKRR